MDGDEGDEMMVRWRLWRRWSPWWQRRGGDGGATVVNMAEVMVVVAMDGDEGDEMMVRWCLWRRWSPWWQRRDGDGGATVVNMAEVMVDVVLVDIVKLAQKQGMKGENGAWKDFLKVYDTKVGVSLSDPARRSPEALIAFLKTFSNVDDLKFFEKVLEKHDSVNQIEKKTDKMSPEQELVYKTVGHPQYAINYSFPSHEEGWMVTKSRKKNKAMRCNTMVAVDCEMVLCEDGTDALVRVCVVDRDLNVKLDELVKPDRAVADYRTHITGVAAKDLEKVTCSLQDVQVSMMKLLARGTILVGHSLNNDLQALKVDHTRVVDTSLVFKYWSGSNFRRPSLNDLYLISVLGYELRKEGEPHDCVEDARAAMKLVLAKIETGVDDTAPVKQNDVNETDGTKLLCHRIPISIPGEKLLEVIPGDFTIEVKASKKAGGDKYSALAVFKTKQEADQAFESFDVEQVKVCKQLLLLLA
ncbi:small RNA degrading nuclease 1 [Tanacetum coccineum]